MDIKNRGNLFGTNYFDMVENEILEDHNKIMEQINYYDQICEDRDQLIENKFVLDKTLLLIQNNDALVTSITSRSSGSKRNVPFVESPEKVSLSL